MPHQAASEREELVRVMAQIAWELANVSGVGTPEPSAADSLPFALAPLESAKSGGRIDIVSIRASLNQ